MKRPLHLYVFHEENICVGGKKPDSVLFRCHKYPLVLQINVLVKSSVIHAKETITVDDRSRCIIHLLLRQKTWIHQSQRIKPLRETPDGICKRRRAIGDKRIIVTLIIQLGHQVPKLQISVPAGRYIDHHVQQSEWREFQ